MAALVYRCPFTGNHVQAWIVDNDDDQTFQTVQTVTCTACLRTHLIDPKTGNVLGAPDDN
jgi:hypothetical protein